jgi:hypothetical protein
VAVRVCDEAGWEVAEWEGYACARARGEEGRRRERRDWAGECGCSDERQTEREEGQGEEAKQSLEREGEKGAVWSSPLFC